jgi:hypothetical protein
MSAARPAALAAPADPDLNCPVVVHPGYQRRPMTAVRRAGLRTKAVHVDELVASVRDDHR